MLKREHSREILVTLVVNHVGKPCTLVLYLSDRRCYFDKVTPPFLRRKEHDINRDNLLVNWAVDLC